MYCTNCGKKLEENEIICQNCGNNSLTSNNNIQNKNNIQTISEEDNKKANKLSILSIILFISPEILILLSDLIEKIINNQKIIMLITNIFTSLYTLAPLAALTLLIYTRIKYPENKRSKILLILMIIIIIIYIIASIIMLFACIGATITCFNNLD